MYDRALAKSSGFGLLVHSSVHGATIMLSFLLSLGPACVESVVHAIQNTEAPRAESIVQRIVSADSGRGGLWAPVLNGPVQSALAATLMPRRHARSPCLYEIRSGGNDNDSRQSD
jgi:hypothetical protein